MTLWQVILTIFLFRWLESILDRLAPRIAVWWVERRLRGGK